MACYESVTQLLYPNSIPKMLEITWKLATGNSPSPVRASPSCLWFGEGGLLHPFPPDGPGNLVWLRSLLHLEKQELEWLCSTENQEYNLLGGQEAASEDSFCLLLPGAPNYREGIQPWKSCGGGCPSWP